MQVRLAANIRRRRRDRLRLRHLVADRNRSRDRHAGAAAIGKKMPSGACARTFGCRTMSGKTSIGEPVLFCSAKTEETRPSRSQSGEK